LNQGSYIVAAKDTLGMGAQGIKQAATAAKINT